MASDRTGRRTDRRAFRPTLDQSAMEPRRLLSAGSLYAQALQHVSPAQLVHQRQLQFFPTIKYYIANGGRKARIRDVDGEFFDVTLTGPGTVQARPMFGGMVALIVRGSTPQTSMLINPVTARGIKGDAHTFLPGYGRKDGILHVGKIEVTSGMIGSVLGFRTADLAGPLAIGGTAPVDRIAFNALEPGAEIGTGGDLNTLDVFTDANLQGGTGIYVGRDLNWMNVRGNLSLTDGAALFVNRDLGLTEQPVKGTGVGGQGALVQGNLSIGPGSALVINRTPDAVFVVDGEVISNPIRNSSGQVIGDTRISPNPTTFIATRGGYATYPG